MLGAGDITESENRHSLPHYYDFIHSFAQQYLLTAYYVRGVDLGTRTKQAEIPASEGDYLLDGEIKYKQVKTH